MIIADWKILKCVGCWKISSVVKCRMCQKCLVVEKCLVVGKISIVDKCWLLKFIDSRNLLVVEKYWLWWSVDYNWLLTIVGFWLLLIVKKCWLWKMFVEMLKMSENCWKTAGIVRKSKFSILQKYIFQSYVWKWFS